MAAVLTLKFGIRAAIIFRMQEGSGTARVSIPGSKNGAKCSEKKNFRMEYTEVPNPLAHEALDISLATITDETENYAQALSAETLSTRTHAHTPNTQTIQTPHKKVEGQILLLCAIRRLALLLIMTLIHYERELEPGLCAQTAIRL